MPLAKPTKPDSITAVPTPVPQRTDRANFAARGDAMMTWFPDGVDEINTTSDYMDDAANFAEQEANEAEASATAAEASNVAAAGNAAAAAASAGATVWVTGTTYAAGNVRYSPTNFQTYRDTVGGVSSTDPAADTTGRWQSAMMPSAEAIALPDMLPTAVFNFAGGVIDRRLIQSCSTPTTRRNSFGNVETVAAGIALPDFDPLTKRCLGYRSSQAATYLRMQSENIAGIWNPSAATLTAGARVGPDGALSATKVEATATGATIPWDVTATAVAQYLVATIYKGTSATVGNSFRVRNQTTATDLVSLSINYDTGVITQSIGTGATAAPVPGGWLLSIPVTTGVSIGNTLRSYFCFSGLASTAGQNAFFAQPYFCDKPNAPYYPTAGSNVTRGADSLTLDLTAHTAILNPAEFTIAVAFTPGVVSVVTRLIFSVGDGTWNNRTYVLMEGSNITLRQVVGGVITTASLAASASRQVAAISYTGNGVKMTHSGGGATALIGTAAIVPMTQFVIGHTGVASGYELNGHVELAAIYPRACTAGELRAFVNNY